MTADVVLFKAGISLALAGALVALVAVLAGGPAHLVLVLNVVFVTAVALILAALVVRLAP